MADEPIHYTSKQNACENSKKPLKYPTKTITYLFLFYSNCLPCAMDIQKQNTKSLPGLL